MKYCLKSLSKTFELTFGGEFEIISLVPLKSSPNNSFLSEESSLILRFILDLFYSEQKEGGLHRAESFSIIFEEDLLVKVLKKNGVLLPRREIASTLVDFSICTYNIELLWKKGPENSKESLRLESKTALLSVKKITNGQSEKVLYQVEPANIFKAKSIHELVAF